MTPKEKMAQWALIDQYTDAKAYYDSRIEVLLEEIGDE